MVFKFTLLSDEEDDFVRVISIDSEATFLELHLAILDAVHYEKNLLTTFFMCSDDWDKGQEVTLLEMESSSEYDNLIMESTKLEELLSDEKQKLVYIFEMMTERAFFIELSEIIPGIRMSKPECVSAQGAPPAQITSEEEFIAGANVNVDENFYGDEDFDIDELDEDGFSDMNFDDTSLFND